MVRYTDILTLCAVFQHVPSNGSAIQMTFHRLLWQHTTHTHKWLAAATQMCNLHTLCALLLLSATELVCLDIARAGCLQL